MASKLNQQDNLHAMRHSLAHIMAAAVQKLYPKAKFGVGPVIENGFYYDVDFGKHAISNDDLAAISAEMHELIEEDLPIERFSLTIAEAKKWAKKNRQAFKSELINAIQSKGTTALKQAGDPSIKAKGKKVSFYKLGDFEDLCQGPHLKSTGGAGAFRLEKIAGAYWRGDENNPQLTRIYGVAFAKKAELNQYLELMEEAKKRDHRTLGEKLGIFMHSAEVGAGLPMLLPRGEAIKHTLMQYMRHVEKLGGYQYVATPALGHEDLYKRSGHAEYFGEEMYSLEDDEGHKFYLRPMNCPHHHQIYERLVQSYRDLPLKLAEAGAVYRKELSGVLSGLTRVRGPITQNDAHIYVTFEQLKQEFRAVLEMVKAVYKEVGLKNYWFRLSLPDFENAKFGGDKQAWQAAATAIRSVMKSFGTKYEEAVGEAAFYGPKIDVQLSGVLGKEETIATIQVDVLVPKRMGLKYVDKGNNEQVPIVIHRAIIGSYERFLAYLIEQTGGNFPIWLAPEQVRIATLNDSKKVLDYAQKLHINLLEAGIKTTLDNKNESVSKKIRSAEEMRVPYTIVVGDNEVKSGSLTPRIRADIKASNLDKPIKVEQFIQTVLNEIKSHVHHSSL